MSNYKGYTTLFAAHYLHRNIQTFHYIEHVAKSEVELSLDLNFFPERNVNLVTITNIANICKAFINSKKKRKEHL